MELKIGAQELAKALGRSQGIVEKKSTMPVLSHVLLEAKKESQLVVSATDLDLAVSSEHACEEVTKEGALAVSARSLYDIVRALPEGSTVALKRVQHSVEPELLRPLDFACPRTTEENRQRPGREAEEDRRHRLTPRASQLTALAPPWTGAP